MSHIVEVAVIDVNNVDAINATCMRLNLGDPLVDAAGGLVTVMMPSYPGSSYKIQVVFNLNTGKASVRSEQRQTLDDFLMYYAIERSKMVAQQEGKIWREETSENGELVLEVLAA